MTMLKNNRVEYHEKYYEIYYEIYYEVIDIVNFVTYKTQVCL